MSTFSLHQPSMSRAQAFKLAAVAEPHPHQTPKPTLIHPLTTTILHPAKAPTSTLQDAGINHSYPEGPYNHPQGKLTRLPVPQILPHEAEARQSPEAKPSHPAVDPSTNWKYYPVRGLLNVGESHCGPQCSGSRWDWMWWLTAISG
jgi:hypothetical protein